MPINIKKGLEKLGVDTKNNLDYKLMQPPRPDKHDEAHYAVLRQGTIQADLQFWNSYNGFKYMLIVVDVVSQNVDVEPMRTKEPHVVIRAFENIFNRKFLFPRDNNDIIYPNVIMTDDGSEFENKKFLDFCTQHKIHKKTAHSGRHQIPYADAYSLLISKLLAIKTTAEQSDRLKNTERITQRNWIKYLPQIREILNDKEVQEKTISEFFQFHKIYPNQILKIGDMVHVKLEKPRDVVDSKLSGKFRTGDYYWEKQPRKIINRIYNLSGNPLRYVVDGIDDATYARSELLKV